MSKIKILYTINFVTNGGPSRVLLNQIYNLNKNEFDIYLLTIIDQNDKSIINNLKKFGVKIIQLKIPKTFLGVVKNDNLIINEVLKINPDIIHTHGIVTSVILSSKKIKCKKVTTIHNNVYEDYKLTYGSLKGILIAKIHLKCLKRFDYIFCCSKTSYEAIDCKFKNITYIRNGIDVPAKSKKEIIRIRQKIRKTLNANNESIIYCYCGVLTKRKRVVELIDYFNEFLSNNEFFIIIGDGPENVNIKNHIKNKNIIMLGFKENVYDYYYASDIYVSNSSSEGFSISIIEALSCNLLMLLSEITSHKECFEIDNSYYIGETFNENFRLKKNEVKSNVGCANTKKFYKENLTGRVMTRKYIDYYKELLGK